jgi:hypothetical protein
LEPDDNVDEEVVVDASDDGKDDDVDDDDDDDDDVDDDDEADARCEYARVVDGGQLRHGGSIEEYSQDIDQETKEIKAERKAADAQEGP